jgi:hypothetical protein
MATIAARPIEPYRTVSGNQPRMLWFPEAASQTFKAGEVVYLVAGYVTLYVADGLAVLGVAAEDAHNGATAGLYSTKVWIADADTIFIANLSGSSVTARSDVTMMYSMTSSSHIWYIDKTDVTNRVLQIVGLNADYATTEEAVGDTNGREHFVFAGRVRQLGATS